MTRSSDLLPLLGLALALAACAPPAAKAPAGEAAPPPTTAVPAAASDAPAGEYAMDLSHTSLILKVSHLGLSNYTARFTRLDGKLNFDPGQPAEQSVTATIDAASLQTDYPEPAKLDFDAQLGREFLDIARHPKISFASTKVEPTGPRTARVTGDLTLRGVTKPVTLEAAFNGGYKAGAMDPSGARIGFSAKGSFKRSDFGITYALPAPGTNMGVGDAIDVLIEAEFTRR